MHALFRRPVALVPTSPNAAGDARDGGASWARSANRTPIVRSSAVSDGTSSSVRLPPARCPSSRAPAPRSSLHGNEVLIAPGSREDRRRIDGGSYATIVIAPVAARGIPARRASSIPIRCFWAPSSSPCRVVPPQLPRQTQERRHQYCGRSQRTSPIARYLRHPTGAAALADGDLEGAQAGGGDPHLHLKVPTEGRLCHAEAIERVAADGPEGRHIGEARAIEKANEEPGKVAGDDLRGAEAARFALSAQPRAEDEIGSAARDWLDQCRDHVGAIAAIAVDEENDHAGRREVSEARKHGSPVAARRLDDDLGAGRSRALSRVITRLSVHDNDLAYAVGEHGCNARADRLFLVEARDDHADALHLEAPAQPTVGTTSGGCIGVERRPERLVGRAIPNGSQTRLRGVAQRIVLVAVLGEGGNAAGQGATVGREVHHRPGTTAQGPGALVCVAGKAFVGFRCPRGVKSDAERVGELRCGIEIALLLAIHSFKQRLIGAREADGVLVEIDEPLQIDLADTDVVGDAHEVAELRDRLLEAGEPQRDAWACEPFAPLHMGESAHIAHDAIEVVLAANAKKRAGLGGIERDTELIEARVAEFAPLPGSECGTVGVEEHVGAACLEIANHARQRLHEHGLTDAVQDHAGNVRYLVDDAREELPAHVSGRLEIGVGTRTGGA